MEFFKKANTNDIYTLTGKLGDAKLIGTDNGYVRLGELFTVDPEELTEVKLEEFLLLPEFRLDRSIFADDEDANIDKVSETDKLYEFIDRLQYYDVSRDAMDNIIDAWATRKAWLINLLRKHPNWDESQMAVVFSQNYDREINTNAISEFKSWIVDNKKAMFTPYKFANGRTYEEIEELEDDADRIYRFIRSVSNRGYDISVDGQGFNFWKSAHKTFFNMRMKMGKEIDSENAFRYDYKYYDHDSKVKYDQIANLLEAIYVINGSNADENFMAAFNKICPEKITAHNNQKISKLIRKACVLIGYDKLPDFEREYAKFADAVNPLQIQRYTVLSVAPSDYIGMSHGNSWTSCMNTDKGHALSYVKGQYSDGCCSSGTVSYLMDYNTLVYYTVDTNYEGEMRFAPKINRCLFMVDKNTYSIGQSRMYPQESDGCRFLYDGARSIVQKIIADCAGITNQWVKINGMDDFVQDIDSTIYADWTFGHLNELTNTSVHKSENGTQERPFKVITIGESPICVCCGNHHSTENSIQCEDCDDEIHYCYNCGERGREDEMHYWNGEWYCEDCCEYCQYHGEYEPREDAEMVWVESEQGYVCDAAIEESYSYCEECNEYFRSEDGIFTEDGSCYCCETCARDAGYTEWDGEWIPEEDLYICEECGCCIHKDDAIEINGKYYCEDCAERIESDEN